MSEVGALDLRAAYVAGQTLDEIARAVGLSHECVRRRLLRQGVAMRPKGHRPYTAAQWAARPKRRVLKPIPIPAWAKAARLGRVYSQIARSDDHMTAADRCRELIAIRGEGLPA